MKPFSLVCLLAAAALTPAVAQKADPFTGRWDLVVTPKAANVKAYPDWMEVGLKDGAPAVRIQPRSGSAFYAKQFKVEGTHLSLQWDNASITWDLDLKGGKLAGVEKRGASVFGDLAGVRAPLLKRDPPKAWTAAASKSRWSTRRWTPTTSFTASGVSTACSRRRWSCRARRASGKASTSLWWAVG